MTERISAEARKKTPYQLFKAYQLPPYDLSQHAAFERAVEYALDNAQQKTVAGWKLVPDYLTKEMRQAIFNNSTNTPLESEMGDLWYDVLIASPPAPVPEPDGECDKLASQNAELRGAIKEYRRITIAWLSPELYVSAQEGLDAIALGDKVLAGIVGVG